MRLQVHVIPAHASPTAAPVPTFLEVASPALTLEDLTISISNRYKRLYPHRPPLHIEKIQDASRNDLDLSYTVEDVFSDKASDNLNSIVRVIQSSTLRESSIPPESGLRPKIFSRGKRARPALLQDVREPSNESGSLNSLPPSLRERSKKRQRIDDFVVMDSMDEQEVNDGSNVVKNWNGAVGEPSEGGNQEEAEAREVEDDTESFKDALMGSPSRSHSFVQMSPSLGAPTPEPTLPPAAPLVPASPEMHVTKVTRLPSPAGLLTEIKEEAPTSSQLIKMVEIAKTTTSPKLNGFPQNSRVFTQMQSQRGRRVRPLITYASPNKRSVYSVPISSDEEAPPSGQNPTSAPKRTRRKPSVVSENASSEADDESSQQVMARKIERESEDAEREKIAKEAEARESECAKQAIREERESREREAKEREGKEARERAAMAAEERDRARVERMDRERVEKEKTKQQMEMERLAKEKAEIESEKQKVEREWLAVEEAERKSIAKEITTREEAAQEEVARLKGAEKAAALEKAAQEKAAQASQKAAEEELAAKEKVAQEKVAQEKLELEEAEGRKVAEEKATQEKALESISQDKPDGETSRGKVNDRAPETKNKKTRGLTKKADEALERKYRLEQQKANREAKKKEAAEEKARKARERKERAEAEKEKQLQRRDLPKKHSHSQPEPQEEESQSSSESETALPAAPNPTLKRSNLKSSALRKPTRVSFADEQATTSAPPVATRPIKQTPILPPGYKPARSSSQAVPDWVSAKKTPPKVEVMIPLTTNGTLKTVSEAAAGGKGTTEPEVSSQPMKRTRSITGKATFPDAKTNGKMSAGKSSAADKHRAKKSIAPKAELGSESGSGTETESDDSAKQATLTTPTPSTKRNTRTTSKTIAQTSAGVAEAPHLTQTLKTPFPKSDAKATKPRAKTAVTNSEEPPLEELPRSSLPPTSAQVPSNRSESGSDTESESESESESGSGSESESGSGSGSGSSESESESEGEKPTLAKKTFKNRTTQQNSLSQSASVSASQRYKSLTDMELDPIPDVRDIHQASCTPTSLKNNDPGLLQKSKKPVAVEEEDSDSNDSGSDDDSSDEEVEKPKPRDVLAGRRASAGPKRKSAGFGFKV